MSPLTALGSSKSPAAVSAGIDRKNDIRVAATRSSPAKSPAEIVAPERETPGTSETHWTTPMKMASRMVMSRSWRRCVATLSASTMTTLHTISADATHQRLRRAPVTRSLPEDPRDAHREWSRR